MAGAGETPARPGGSGLIFQPGLLPWQLFVFAYACGLYAAHGPLAAGLALSLGWWLNSLYHGPAVRPLVYAAIFAAGLGVGLIALPGKPGPQPGFVATAEKVELTGTVAGVEFRPGRRLEILLENASAKTRDSATVRLNGLVALTCEDAPRIPAPGDGLRLATRVRPAGGFANQGHTERAFGQELRGVYHTAYAGQNSGLELTPAAGTDAAFALRLYLRGLILGAKNADTGLPDADSAITPGRGVVLALLTGDRSYLGSADLDRVRRATLTHTLALAGLHLGFVALMGVMLAHLFGRLWPGVFLYVPRPKLAVVLGAPLVAGYLWLGQFTPSLTRAAVMFASWGLLLLLNRNRVLIDGLFLAVAVILAVSPLSVFDLRMQLSVAAVAGIAVLMPLGKRLYPGNRESRLSRLVFPAWELFWVSLCAQLGVLPLITATFGEISPHLLYNLLWVPVMGLAVMPASLAGLVLSLIPIDIAHSAGQALFGLASWIGDGFLASLVFLDRHGLIEAWPGLRPVWPESLGFFLLLAALVGYLATGLKRPALTALGLAFLLAPQAQAIFDESRDQVELTMFDVGQGQSLLVRAPGGGRALIDGGGFRGEFDTGRDLIAPLLTSNAPPRLAALVMTHPDRDHALGTLYPLETFSVGSLWTNGDAPPGELGQRYERALARSGLAANTALAGEGVDLGGGVRLDFVHPEMRSKGDTNERSVVARLTWRGAGLALLTADVGRHGIDETLASGLDVAATVMTAPHHGSAKSGVPTLYDRVRPSAVLASCGLGNQWGFPSKAVRNEAERIGARFYATSESGAITATWTSPDNPPEITTVRAPRE